MSDLRTAKSSSSEEPSEQKEGWTAALATHFLLFGYWMMPADLLRDRLQYPSRKTSFLSRLNVIGTSFFVAVALQSLLDGPEMLTQYLSGNFLVYSQTLYTWGFVSLLFLTGVVIVLGFFIPFVENCLIIRRTPKDARPSRTLACIAAAYGILSVLFYAPLVYVGFMLGAWQDPQMIHLLTWQEESVPLYVLGGILLLGILGNALCSRKVLSFNWRQAFLGSILALSLVLASTFPFAL